MRVSKILFFLLFPIIVTTGQKKPFLEKEGMMTIGIYDNSMGEKHFSKMNSILDYANRAILTKNKSQRYYNAFNLFIDCGYIPFKLSVGLGYHYKSSFELYYKFSQLYLPLVINYKSNNLGLKKFLNRRQSFFFSFEVGGFNSKYPIDYNGFFNGGNTEIGLGHLFYKKGEYYIEIKIRAQVFIHKFYKPDYFPGIDIAIGLYTNQ